ncbi:MAG TPA: glycosyltransferase [Casimicrobiaceae bacterium]|nr:glycosyltransferase [Casimicrobiaceae bacterium]
MSAQGRPKREQVPERVSAEGRPPQGDRLAIAHTESSLGWGGQEIRTLTEAAGFIGRGHRVILYAAPGSRIAAEAPRFGVPVTVLPIGRKRPAGVRSLVANLRRHAVDIVNAHSSTDAWLAALACAWLARTRRAAPVLVRTRHVSIPVPRDFATRWLYQTATARVVTTGAALREQLIRDNGLDAARVASVPTGIDTAAFAPLSRAAARRELGLPDTAPLAGIVATLRSWKGHRYLVEATPLLRRRDARLVIVGDGPQRAALEAQVARLDLSERVLFAGERTDVARWLAALDVFVLPSYANEGVPQALLQAMLAGIPCVTTDAGAIPEIARDGDTARIVPRENAAALAAAIDSVFDDPAASAAIAERARAFVLPRFGIETMLDRMEAVFCSALAERETLGRR